MTIQLGKFKTNIDDEDYELFMSRRWYVSENNYVVSQRQPYASLHRLLMNAPEDMSVDHLNGNTLDNRKSNLRICTQFQNMANRKMNLNNKSGYKGVHWDATRSKQWAASIGVNNQKINLGSFPEARWAAMAYDLAAQHYFGDYARLNFPNAIIN